MTDTPIPLGRSDYRRGVADEPEVPVVNRYFEENPTNLVDQVALLSRPRLKRFIPVGQGPIRTIYSQPGSFNDALFVVSYDEIYRVDTDESVTRLAGGITGSSLKATVSMAATARLGSTPEYLYIADGRVLWLYTAEGPSTGTLTSTGAIASGYVVKVDSTYYQWTSGSVDAGTPDGTVSAPWLMTLGVDNTASLNTLRIAINALGIAGTDYSTNLLVANPTVQASTSTSTQLHVNAIAFGAGGDGIPVAVSSAPNLSWGASTLTGGGSPTFTQVATPDDVGVVSVGYVSGFVIVVIAQGYGVNGRFYWIEPGETIIDPLNFATAERSPDPIISVRVVGDQFWLLGTNSTEVWYPSGDATAPFQRVQGRLFDRGIWEGTDMAVKDAVLVVDNDGIVYSITGGGPVRISNSSIEERMRDAINIASGDII